MTEDNYVTITKEEYESLKDSYDFLCHLEACSVDEWEGYEMAREGYENGREDNV